MAILQECPQCKKRAGIDKKVCACGFKLVKGSHKVYWIEYYIFGRRKRERIGPNKLAAENRLREALTQRTEDRYIDKNKNARVTFDELAKWYLQLPGVKAKRSYVRDACSIKQLSAFFSGKLVKDITPAQVEAYRQKRLLDPPYHKTPTAPATINREVAGLKHIFNLAEREGKIETTPLKHLKMLKENNVRNRVLTHEEYESLLGYCPPHTAQVVKMAYYTAMRQGEILNLTWDRIDLKSGFIRLKPEDTKTNEARAIPIHPEVMEMLKAMPRTIHGRVFTLDGKPLSEVKRSFKTACNKAGLVDVVFHTLRHTCINNWRLQGHDFFRIMAVSGHKTMEVFKRYNTVTEEELKRLISGTMDTYMDTTEKKDSTRIG